MSARENTFIDAYGLELNDELQGTHAEPTRVPRGAVREPNTVEASQPSAQSYRFDAAARRQTLRGPHFDMRRVGSQTSDETPAWDTLDMNVIDVGAAWSPSTVVAQTPSHDDAVASPPSHAVEPAATLAVTEVKESPGPEQEVAEVATPVAVQAKVAAIDAEQVMSPELPSAAEIEAPAAEAAISSSDSTAHFAPVWEVDRFQWPDDIEQLFQARTEYFDYAGQKLVAASREGLNILAITSTRSREGSTTLALCLARAAAGAGAKVGLLDGNLIRSELGEKLGVDFASGWQSAAALEQPLGEAAITGLEENITLFPSAAGPIADLDSLADERVGQVLRAAAANFDLLILDAGQADLGDNVKVLDAAIVVRDIRHTSQAETLNAAAALRNCGVKAVGLAENFSSSPAVRAAA